MVQFLIGRRGAGKSDRVFALMAARAGERRQILLVPEQYSHRAERRLCAAGGNLLSLNGEALTFTRLANRVFSARGGAAAPVLDQGGRVLLMYLAVQSTRQGLTVYRHPSRKPAFLSGLLETLDECKSYAVSPRSLAKAGGELGGAAGEKLQDLGLILSAYDALCEKVGADPRDRLTRLAKTLGDCDWGAGWDFYLDGFTEFTPQQSQVLRPLLERAHSVTFALTCDHLAEDEEGMGIFSPARRTAARLIDLARDVGQRVTAETLESDGRDKDPALVHLERELFAPTKPAQWAGPAPVVCLAAKDPRQEMEWTAAEILRLCREEGLRFREIAITARNFDGYEELAHSVFDRFGVPVFLARTQDILEKPILALITGALDAIQGGYRYEDLFRYLKTGLANLTDEERDRLENYVLTWDIKGGRWTARQPWHMHPGGYGATFEPEDEEAVAALDELRRQVIAPLERLRRTPGKTGRDRAIALYDFLEEIDLPRTLERRVAALGERGELNLADEYTQLWDVLVGALEECGRLLAEVEMDLDEFAQLFVLVLSQYQVGSIPVALDRVTAGSCTRLGYEGYKAVFFLGCDDRHVPACESAKGLLTDDDRQALAQLGLTLAPLGADKLHREMTVAYEAATLPTRRLYLTYPVQQGGEECRPSFLIHRVQNLFPGVGLTRVDPAHDPRLAAPAPAMELAVTHPEVRVALARIPELAPRVARLESAMNRDRGSLSPAGVTALYGHRAPMSASRLDLYRSCHFSYFMRYGLKAQPRQGSGFDAPQYGTFVHAVLEEVLRAWDKSMTSGETRRLTREAMERYLAETLGGLDDKSPRFAYLFRRLGSTVERVVENVTDELRRSDFTPMAFELGFGKGKDLPPVELDLDGFTVSLSGFVDRVDGWEHEGKLYLRVVDYKTGRKAFDFTDIFNGIGLQMLLYLFTLEGVGREYFGKEVVPAGVLYIPAREAVVSGRWDMSEEERQAQVDKALTRKGLLLGDPAVLDAMEAPDGRSRFLPIRILKDGTIRSDSLASLEQLGKLAAHVDRILNQVALELKAGTVAADPYWRGEEENACLWCPYHSACQFEEGVGGDCRRSRAKMDAQTFWDALEGGGDRGI